MTDQNYTPKNFQIKGSTARGSTIDDEIKIDGSTASIREGKDTRQAAVPRQFFTIAGYAPAAMQMMMMRYIAKNKVKGPLPSLPGGTVSVEDRGKDVVNVDGKPTNLERYIVTGLIWGREWIWMDKQLNLVALVGVDAEFDHFEAIRDGYEPSLGFFISKAADDGMAALADMSKQISPQSQGVLAITNANLIDGTGKPVVANAVVVVEERKDQGRRARLDCFHSQGSDNDRRRRKVLITGALGHACPFRAGRVGTRIPCRGRDDRSGCGQRVRLYQVCPGFDRGRPRPGAKNAARRHR